MMKTILIIQFIVFLFFSDYLFGQEQDTTLKYVFDRIGIDTVYFKPEFLPEYPGGELELKKHIATEFRNPYTNDEIDEYVFNNYNFYCGKAFVRFIVTKTGDMKNISMVRQKAEKYENECIRVDQTFKKFKPAFINGQPVNSWYNVTFVLNID